jgi:hypothetical protein
MYLRSRRAVAIVNAFQIEVGRPWPIRLLTVLVQDFTNSFHLFRIGGASISHFSNLTSQYSLQVNYGHVLKRSDSDSRNSTFHLIEWFSSVVWHDRSCHQPPVEVHMPTSASMEVRWMPLGFATSESLLVCV